MMRCSPRSSGSNPGPLAEAGRASPRQDGETGRTRHSAFLAPRKDARPVRVRRRGLRNTHLSRRRSALAEVKKYYRPGLEFRADSKARCHQECCRAEIEEIRNPNGTLQREKERALWAEFGIYGEE